MRYFLRFLEKRVVDTVGKDYGDQRIVQTGNSAVVRSPSPLWGVCQRR